MHRAIEQFAVGELSREFLTVRQEAEGQTIALDTTTFLKDIDQCIVRHALPVGATIPGSTISTCIASDGAISVP